MSEVNDEYKNLNRLFPFDKDPNEKIEEPVKEEPKNEEPSEPVEAPNGLDRFLDNRFDIKE